MNILAVDQPFNAVLVVFMCALLVICVIQALKYYGLKDSLAAVYGITSLFLIGAIAYTI